MLPHFGRCREGIATTSSPGEFRFVDGHATNKQVLTEDAFKELGLEHLLGTD